HGKAPEALASAQRALSLAQESENYLDVGLAWRALGQAAAANKTSGSESAAADGVPHPETCFAESLKVFQQINCDGEQAQSLRAWAKFELQEGQTEAARKKAEDASTI